MDIQQVSYPDLAFVDIETTGSHFDRDRITEIGIKTLAPVFMAKPHLSWHQITLTNLIFSTKDIRSKQIYLKRR